MNLESKLTILSKKYSAGGQEKIFGSQSHGSNLKALELFKEFYVVFDSENIL